MNQGIPEFRLPRDIIRKEIEQIEMLGVEILCNQNIGVDITFLEAPKIFLTESDHRVSASHPPNHQPSFQNHLSMFTPHAQS